MQFTIQGKNIISPTAEERAMKYDVPEVDQINVAPGDFIALYYQWHTITTSKCQANVMPENSNWMKSDPV